VSADNNGASFSYDPLGRRVAKTVMSTTTNFLYDGANAVQEFGTNPTANLLTGGVDERFQRTTATETDNYLTDAQGSTLALTSASGATEAQYSYAPYGNFTLMGSTTNSYGYTGREFDGLGIDYYRARYYNPTTGRFLSEDPAGFRGSGTNLYAYAFDNPIQFTDPFGLSGTLTIYSLGVTGQGLSGWGMHSWVSYTPDGGPTTTFGTWGNGANGTNLGLNFNAEVGFPYTADRSQYLNDAQEASLMALIQSYWDQGANGWQKGRPCSSFASDAWKAGTGEYLDPYNQFYISNPGSLTQSIMDANNSTSWLVKFLRALSPF
jgi:RHS repeat-associated protein